MLALMLSSLHRAGDEVYRRKVSYALVFYTFALDFGLRTFHQMIVDAFQRVRKNIQGNYPLVAERLNHKKISLSFMGPREFGCEDGHLGAHSPLTTQLVIAAVRRTAGAGRYGHNQTQVAKSARQQRLSSTYKTPRSTVPYRTGQKCL